MFAVIHRKTISCLKKYFVKSSKITLKMDTLFNSAAYWGCFQGTLIFELRFDYKSMAQCSF